MHESQFPRPRVANTQFSISVLLGWKLLFANIGSSLSAWMFQRLNML